MMGYQSDEFHTLVRIYDPRQEVDNPAELTLVRGNDGYIHAIIEDRDEGTQSVGLAIEPTDLAAALAVLTAKQAVAVIVQ
jgi:hypothetical protein